MLAIESLDSDGDPGGTSNIDEIDADTQPGWTDGPNNTIYFDDGSTQTGQSAPAGILGNLDPADPWADLGNALGGTNGDPVLTGSGSLAAGTTATLTLSNALPNGSAWFLLGLTAINAPFKFGVMVPSPDIMVPALPIDPNGQIILPFIWPTGLPSGAETYYQWWIQDPGGIVGWASSNGIVGTTP